MPFSDTYCIVRKNIPINTNNNDNKIRQTILIEIKQTLALTEYNKLVK